MSTTQPAASEWPSRSAKREGSKVVIADDLHTAKAAAAEIEAAGGEASGRAMDVTVEDAVNAGVAAVIEAYGQIDILLGNAGIRPPGGRVQLRRRLLPSTV